jgi:hypothetical protein
MRTAPFIVALACFVACGSLDNEPLRTGVIRGQLANPDSGALVAVVGREDLSTRPDAEGRFELRSVPVGPRELLVLINASQSRRLSVDVGPASIVELGVVEAAPSVEFEVYVKSPGGQRVTGGTVALLGTPLVKSIKPPEDEAEFHLPPGCYEALVSVPGLGSTTVSGCLDSAPLELDALLDVPDGSPGREGCEVTGCKGLLACQPDRSCR